MLSSYIFIIGLPLVFITWYNLVDFMGDPSGAVRKLSLSLNILMSCQSDYMLYCAFVAQLRRLL